MGRMQNGVPINCDSTSVALVYVDRLCLQAGLSSTTNNKINGFHYATAHQTVVSQHRTLRIGLNSPQTMAATLQLVSVCPQRTAKRGHGALKSAPAPPRPSSQSERR